MNRRERRRAQEQTGGWTVWLGSEWKRRQESVRADRQEDRRSRAVLFTSHEMREKREDRRTRKQTGRWTGWLGTMNEQKSARAAR